MKDIFRLFEAKLREWIREEVSLQLTHKEPVVIPKETSAKTIEQGNYGGNGGGRPRWYFSKDLNQYPDSIRVIIPGYKDQIVTHNGHMWPRVVGSQGGFALKQSDNGSLGMAIVAGPECQTKSCRVEY